MDAIIDNISIDATSVNVTVIAERIRAAFGGGHAELMSDISAKTLNKLLIASGDLVETAIGKVETKQGRENGISGVYREPENKKPYWQPLYAERGQRYVIALVMSKISEGQAPLEQEELIAEAQQNAAAEPEPMEYIPSCDDCRMSEKYGCGIKSEKCDDFKQKPTITQEEREGFPPYGDATRIAFGERLE